MSKQRIKAVIFDMDGLMFDSERVIMRAWEKIGQQWGYEHFGDNIYNTLGMNRNRRRVYFKEKYGEAFPYEEFQEAYSKLALEDLRLNGVPIKKGLFELLDYLKERKYLMAVATSSSEAYAREKLRESGAEPYFPEIICGNMVTHSKPAPEIYLKACQALGIQPEEGLVLEDSENGIRAALSAGIPVIMIPDLLKSLPELEPCLAAKLEDLSQVISYLENQRECGERIVEIKDFQAPELDVYARITEGQLLNRHEPEKGIFIAESPKVIVRALDAGYEPISFLVEKKHLETQARELLERCPQVPVYTAEFEVLKQLTGFPLTRGMLCAMRRKTLPTVEEVCRGAHRIAVLENVVNPTNVGAIIRSAAALHMDAVLLTSACSNPLYRRAVRVSMGTVFQIPWTFMDDLTATGIDVLHKLGFQTAAMALRKDSVSLDDPRLMAEEKLAIILGTEGDGLAADTIADCDYTVCIPMSHGVDSLNVAAASAVAFWQLGRRD